MPATVSAVTEPELPTPIPSHPKVVQRQAIFMRLLRMLMPWRRWIILSNLLILLSSFFAVFSLLAILPILQLVFSPPGADGSGDGMTLLQAEPTAPEVAAPSALEPAGFFGRLQASYRQKRDAIKSFAFEGVRRDPVRTVYWICLIFGLATLVRLGLDYASKVCIIHIQTQFQRRLTADLYRHLLNHDLAFFQWYPPGALMNRVYNDIAKFSQAIELTYGTRVRQPITLLFLTILLFMIHAPLAALVLVSVPLLLVPTLLIARTIREISKHETDDDSSVMELMQEQLSGIGLIKTHGAEQHQARRFDAANDAMFERRRRRTLLTSLADPVMESLTTLGLILIIVLGVAAVLRLHWIEGEVYLFFLIVLSRFYKPLKELFNVNVQLQRPLMSIQTVFKLLDIAPKVVEDPAAVPWPADWQRIEFQKVWFRYSKRRQKVNVLRDINLTIERGRSLALVGHNGSGKTTLGALLGRLYDPIGGRITVDGIDLRQIRRAELRRQIGIVQQHALLFDLTVAENIAFGIDLDQIDLERVRWAAEAAGAAAFIDLLPQGLQSVVGPCGKRLSGGQRQLIALARVFYHDCAIIIFDEPTTGLDIHAEANIMRALQSLRGERTVIMITHNLEHTRGFDRIVLMRGGEIVQDGPPDQIRLELLREGLQTAASVPVQPEETTA